MRRLDGQQPVGQETSILITILKISGGGGGGGAEGVPKTGYPLTNKGKREVFRVNSGSLRTLVLGNYRYTRGNIFLPIRPPSTRKPIA